MKKQFTLFGLLLTILCSCASKSHYEAEVVKWEKSGWKFEETVGVVKSDATYVSHFESATGLALTAFGTDENGEQLRKQYFQENKLYLIVGMGVGLGPDYSIVFTKPK